MSAKARVPENLRAKQRRAGTADHFRLMADYAPVMIWLADADGRSVYFNRQWLNFRGRTLEEELGLAWLEGIHADDRDRCLAAHFASLESREPFEMNCRLRRADGEHRHVRVNGTPIIDGQRLAGFVGSCVDVTDQVAAHERERMARVSAEAATLARDQFLAIVSHELRSPLNAIKSWTHVLENQLHEVDDHTTCRAIDGIMIGVEQQVRLIEDLLDMTRALNGNLVLVRQPMALAPALDAVLEGLRSVADEKGVRLTADASIADAQINGDWERVQQIFSNLVSNAIKFTPRGGNVRVSAAIEGSMACVEVRDDGAGIPAKFLPHVFDPFRQADLEGASRRTQQGLGLGVALVQHLAQLHGGHVTCRSAGVGRGATFRVHLPLGKGDRGAIAVAHVTTPTASTLPSLAGIKVMVVDDKREHRESLGALLEQAGASVVLASSGKDALKRLDEQKIAGEADIIVCDIAMPTDDGYATLQRIRAWESSRGIARRPAIAISAFTERKDRLRALNAGFQMHLTKPIVPADLIVVIASVARGPQSV